MSISISAPLKEEYAKANNLDYERLLDSSSYKENFRAKMIE
jgi:phosphomevalonate kinase